MFCICLICRDLKKTNKQKNNQPNKQTKNNKEMVVLVMKNTDMPVRTEKTVEPGCVRHSKEKAAVVHS